MVRALFLFLIAACLLLPVRDVQAVQLPMKAEVVTSHTLEGEGFFNLAFDRSGSMLYLQGSRDTIAFDPITSQFDREATHSFPGGGAGPATYDPLREVILQSTTVFTGWCDYCGDVYDCTGWGLTDIHNDRDHIVTGYHREILGMTSHRDSGALWLIMIDSFNACVTGDPLGGGLFLVQAETEYRMPPDQLPVLKEMERHRVLDQHEGLLHLSHDSVRDVLWMVDSWRNSFRAVSFRGVPLYEVVLPPGLNYPFAVEHHEGDQFWAICNGVLYLLHFPLSENSGTDNWAIY